MVSAKKLRKWFLFCSSLIGLAALAVLFAIQPNQGQEAKAGTAENNSGWVWSANTGWWSFNNTSGGGSTNYGVYLNPLSKEFSGYAWSENIGYITFNESELDGCPSMPCRARYNQGNGDVDGWVRACSVFDSGCSGSLKSNSQRGGWLGWIKLRGQAANGAPYGLTLNLVTRRLEGWAWGGGSEDSDSGKAVIGWVSFNCANQGNCSSSNYSVLVDINFPPSPQSLAYNPGNYCLDATALRPIFSWTFFDLNPGDFQSAYQVQVATDNNFNPPSIIFDSNKVNSDSTTYAPISPLPAYNATYYWRVKLWDNYSSGEASDWVEASSSFQTPKHAYPKPNFALFPPIPTKGESVQLCATQYATTCPADVARCYDDAGNQISCSGQIFNWSLPADAVYIDGTNSSSPNPRVQLFSIGNDVFTLAVTDNTLPATCSFSKTIKLVPAPQYKPIW